MAKEKKKILLLTSTWNDEYISKLIHGIIRRIGSENVDLFILNAYDMIGYDDYQEKEREIYDLSDFRSYDGVLVAVSSVGNIPAAEMIVRRLEKLKAKYLCVEHEFPGIPYAGVNNYRSVYNLVAHMITEHGCKVFNFIGGPRDHTENMERYQAFCQCLRDHGLELDERRARFYSFQYDNGSQAYDAWKEMGLSMPDAVICGNDDMALGYCMAAEEDGWFAPEDFRITGFDNSEEARQFYPSITSVNREWEKLGYLCLDRLFAIIDGTEKGSTFYVEESYHFNESCGCNQEPRNVQRDISRLFRQKKRGREFTEHQRTVRQMLCRCQNEEDISRILPRCAQILRLPSLAVCVNATFTSPREGEEWSGHEKEMHALFEGKRVRLDRMESLIPPEWTDPEHSQVYLFSTLHFMKRTFGYCVLRYKEQLMEDMNHRVLMESIALALENIRQRAELNLMNQRLKDLYVQDSMTGLYNRFGYLKMASGYFHEKKGRIYLIYLDMDNLKFFNDHFGHALGDQAILGISQTIRKVFASDCILVRMGGDEFLVIGEYTGEESILARERSVTEELENYSLEKNLPCILEVSMGHVWSEGGQIREGDLEKLVKLADDAMYVLKQKRKRRNGAAVRMNQRYSRQSS